MFNNNFGGGQNQINVSTRFKTSASDTSLLAIGAWNNNISLRVTPSVGVDANGQSMYDKNRGFQTALTQENARALYEKYKEEILPLIERREFTKRNVAVPVGKDDKRTMVAIEMEPVDDGYDMYLTFYTILTPQNTAMESNIFRHRFKKTQAVTNYDYLTGNCEQTCFVESDFQNFITILEGVGNILPVAAHGVRYENAVSALYSNNRNNSGQSQGTGWNAQSSSGSYASQMQASMNAPSGGYQNTELPFLN